jgi:hypothetical protein
VFSGAFINSANVPSALRFLKDASLIKYAYEGMAVNELTGLEFVCDGARGPCIKTGEQMLERISFADSTVSGSLANLFKLLGASYLLTYVILARSKPSFQPMLEPIDYSVVGTGAALKQFHSSNGSSGVRNRFGRSSSSSANNKIASPVRVAAFSK